MCYDASVFSTCRDCHLEILRSFLILLLVLFSSLIQLKTQLLHFMQDHVDVSLAELFGVAVEREGHFY